MLGVGGDFVDEQCRREEGGQCRVYCSYMQQRAAVNKCWVMVLLAHGAQGTKEEIEGGSHAKCGFCHLCYHQGCLLESMQEVHLKSWVYFGSPLESLNYSSSLCITLFF